MKTLYLHIGTPKTATSAIQYFCYKNQSVLAEKGYYYPLFDYVFPRVNRNCNAHFLLTYGNEYPYIEEGVKKIFDLFKTYDNIILSDEKIWNGGFYYHCWEQLKENIIDKGICIKVIVYLRRQDEFLFSWWNQRIKAGKKNYSTITWDELVHTRPYIQLNYYESLEQIAAYVGKENIIVRVFDKKTFLNNDPNKTILADFVRSIGLEYTEDYTVTDLIRNPSLSKNNVEIKRILNMLPDVSSEENMFFRNIMVGLSSEGVPDNTKSMFSPEELDNFFNDYKEGNMRIAKEYLNAEKLFDYTYNADGKWTLDNLEFTADVIRFFGTTTLFLLRELKQLKAQQQIQDQHITNLRFKLKHPAKYIARRLTNMAPHK